jgi:hypothetical protein
MADIFNSGPSKWSFTATIPGRGGSQSLTIPGVGTAGILDPPGNVINDAVPTNLRRTLAPWENNCVGTRNF